MEECLSHEFCLKLKFSCCLRLHGQSFEERTSTSSPTESQLQLKQFKRVVHESIKVLRKCWKHLQNISCHATIKDAKHNTMSKSRSVDMTASFTEKTSCFFSCYTLTSQSLGLPKLRDQWRHHGDVETICGLVHQPSIQALRETATDSCPPDLPPDRLPLKGSKVLARMWRTLDMSWGFFLACDCDIVGSSVSEILSSHHRNSSFGDGTEICWRWSHLSHC